MAKAGHDKIPALDHGYLMAKTSITMYKT